MTSLDTYFDSFGMLSANSYEGVGENNLLFTAEYLILEELARPHDDFLHGDNQMIANRLLQLMTIEAGKYRQRPDDYARVAAHDNMTAIICLSYFYKLNFHKQAKVLVEIGKYWHPRDFLFYNYVKGGLRKWLVLPFMWLHSLIMIETSISKTKTRPTLWNRFTTFLSTGTWPAANTMIKTDIELLNFLKFKCVGFPLTEKICNYFLKKRFGEKIYLNMFATYFKDPYHPNNALARIIYG